MPRARILAILLFCLGFSPLVSHAQYQPPSDFVIVNAAQAFTWNDGPTNVVQLQGPVSIKLDRATLTADRAVMWFTPVPGTVLDQQHAEIALIGNASVQQADITRTGDSLYVEVQIRGVVSLTAQTRAAQNLSDSDLYRDASALRPLQNIATGAQSPNGTWITQHPWMTLPPSSPPPASEPTTKPVRPTQHVSLLAGGADTVTTPDGTIAAMLWNGASVVEVTPSGDVIQLQANRIMLFTPMKSLQEMSTVERLKAVEGVVESAYLEGDVRITLTPHDTTKGEQRLEAQRVFFELTTLRAVLTEAVIHTIDPQRQIPLVLRAHLVRQLSAGEYKAEGVELTTSSFATPTFSINAERAYVRQYDTQDARLGNRTVFSSVNNTFDIYHIPVFYWPWAAGSMTDRGTALRELLFGSSRGFGPGVRTKWGLFESLGRPRPEDLDIAYSLDYFGDRGPAGGVDVNYKGGFITETSKQAWDFQGDFTSYVAQDHGLDRLGRERRLVQPDDDTRYRALWEHQHFFPGDWQLQLRASVVSDPTFLEEWFENEFNNGLPHDESIYLKRQRQSEAITLEANVQPNNFVTTADSLQEQFEVERYPELGYRRIGDSLFDDQFTFYSDNTVSALHFKQSDSTLAELGFRPGQNPGIPSVGTTGVTDDTIYRGDLRQELDYPMTIGQFRVMPYVMGRYTGYDDSPDGSDQHRVFVGTGARISTAFWRVDNNANSDLLDIHRVRHVIEPEVNFFTSAQTVDRTDVFNYDENVDEINDITGVQLAVHQRWQTKRGGPGQYRSVDFFTLNTEANFFTNQPNDDVLNPKAFRGLYFPSAPETSLPRNSINADALWRVSDSTAILSDMQYNLDTLTLATTSIGMTVQRDARMSYFLGTRYIGELNSTIATFGMNYDLTAKYSVRFTESVNLSERRNQDTSVTITRKFDRFFVTLTLFYDAVDSESGFRFGIYPEGLGYGLSSDQLQPYLNNNR